MTIKILANDTGTPPGKLADAELHFTDGPLDGLKLIGFSVWQRSSNSTRNVTFPARSYSVNGERDGRAYAGCPKHGRRCVMAVAYRCDRCGADMGPAKGARLADYVMLGNKGQIYVTVAMHLPFKDEEPDLCELCRLDAIHKLAGAILDRRQREQDALDAAEGGV